MDGLTDSTQKMVEESNEMKALAVQIKEQMSLKVDERDFLKIHE